ncbi:MAG TPA: HEAT repeat domain-containing protein, partial [Bacillota bacterium]|nr:HEAT repeat domain-containing protein [Bacillota bacterium]
MKKTLFLTATLSFMVLGLSLPLYAAQTNEEQLIQILQSSCGPAEKDAACAQLKRNGTARSVPALAALLTDEQLSHSARYVLESMPVPEAERALLDALNKTAGLTKVGIVQSLGARGETRAVPALKTLLAPSDVPVACAAARALGQIGNGEALKALQAAIQKTTGQVHIAVADSILRCADRLLVSGSQSKARSAFERLYTQETQDYIRIAAYRGLLRASGGDALFRMTQAIPGKEPLSQIAALQFVHEVQAREATATLAQLLPRLELSLQVALIEGLAQRNDPAAAPALADLAESKAPEVRLAVIKALGSVGGSSVVPILAGFAASATGPEQSAARQALAELHRGRVTETLVAQLANSRPAVQAELARALGQRGDRTAITSLVNLAQQGSDSARQGALLALAQLVQESQVGFLVQIALDAKSAAARTEAADALNAAYQRLKLKRGPIDTEPLVKGLKLGSPEARVALLPVCSGLATREVRVALRSALQDP